MGTRNLTIVKHDGKTKIAQYGQWDGYPTGQGETIAEFLKTANLDIFRQRLTSLKEVNEDEVKKFITEELKCPDGWMNQDQANQFKEKYPGLNRDHGAGILQLILDGAVTEIRLSEDFKNDTLFCEYYYTIDLDKGTVSVNGGKEYPFAEWTPELMEKLEEGEPEV